MTLGSAEILPIVLRASRRSSAVVHADLKHGLTSLATIATLAPWVGLLGTIWGMLNSFPAIGGSMSYGSARVVGNLSGSLWPTAFGLSVGITALLCYRYLDGRLQHFDYEMEDASLGLVANLRRQPGRFSRVTALRIGARPMFGEKPLSDLARERHFLRRSIYLAGTAVVMAWLVHGVRYFYHDQVPLYAAAQATSVYVLFTLGLSYFPAYPVWVKLLHRRRGGLAAVGSVFRLGWSIAEFLVGRHLP